LKLDPNTDPRLTKPERALYGRIYPLIEEIEAELEVSISRLVAVNMVRRAVTEGADIDDLLAELLAHGQHQAEHNASKRH
jgi:hypothetical protein